jgi:ABC-type antimicrobial peptide transport system permease subunit
MTPWEGAISKVEALTERIRQINGADNATMQWSNPMGIAFSGAGFEYSGKKDLVTGMTSIKAGDDHFIPLYKVRLIAGRNISPSDTVNEIVINEKLSKTMGFETPIEAIGEHLKVNKRTLPIVGVVQDFHQMSFRVPMENCVIGNFRKEEHSIGIRLESPDLAASTDVITKIESEFKQIYPDEPFGFQFVEDEIAWMHQEEQKTSNLATIAMAVTIFISCMGVFGLAMFTAAMRTREIGIRKVLGASTVGIVNMLSREFTMLIVISIVIATPIAWYYMNDWLHGFTYRTDLSWWLFIAAGAIALLTGLITVSYQSFKAATSDPVKALRTE